MRGRTEEFLDWIVEEKKCTLNTVAAYRNDLTQFLTFLENKGIVQDWPDVVEEDIRFYIQWLDDRQYASSTIARKLAAVRSFFHFLVGTGKSKDDPTVNVNFLRAGKAPLNTLSKSEVRLLLGDRQGEDTPKRLRDQALLKLVAMEGLKASEVVSLNIDDLNLEEGSLCKRGRRGVEVLIKLDAEISEILKNYLEKERSKLVRGKNEPALFINMRGNRLTRQGLWLIVKKRGQEVGIEGEISPRTLRRSYSGKEELQAP